MKTSQTKTLKKEKEEEKEEAEKGGEKVENKSEWRFSLTLSWNLPAPGLSGVGRGLDGAPPTTSQGAADDVDAGDGGGGPGGGEGGGGEERCRVDAAPSALSSSHSIRAEIIDVEMTKTE